MLRRWLLAAVALASGLGVSLGLLLTAQADSGGEEALVLVRDVPAGTPLGAGAVTRERVRLGTAATQVVAPGSVASLAGRAASHQLAAGQVLQRSDLVEAGAGGDRRRVLVGLHDTPPLAAGDRVDLLVLGGPPDHPTVAPFASGLSVASASAAGVVVEVPAAAAPALVWAAAATHLVAVAGAGGLPRAPGEVPVTTLDQARALVRP